MNRCKDYGLGYIDNSNIEVGYLAQDGLHQNEIGKSCLANNFINFINRYILWYEEACNDSDNCLSNAAQENYIDPKENKPVNSSNIQEENSLDSFRKLRLRNANKVIIGNININSLPAKFDQVKEVILKNVDILVITETKLDDTFPLGQFYVEGFTMPYRLDRNCNGGGVIIYVREDIPSKILEKHKLPQDVEGMFVELNFRKVKWLLFGTYHPLSQNDQYYFEALDKGLDCYSSYDRMLLIGDFNSEEHETYMETFLYQHNLTNIVKEGTCFKNSSKPFTINLFLTNNSFISRTQKIFLRVFQIFINW